MLKPGSAVFTPPDFPSNNYSDWWKYVPGANWKKPYGPSGPGPVPDEPVVHLAWDDMVAYAEWRGGRSEEHTSELQSLMRISYAVFCLKKKILYTQRTIQ